MEGEDDQRKDHGGERLGQENLAKLAEDAHRGGCGRAARGQVPRDHRGKPDPKVSQVQRDLRDPKAPRDPRVQPAPREIPQT